MRKGVLKIAAVLAVLCLPAMSLAAAPGTPVLSSPAAGAVLSGTSVTLVWNPVSGAGAYSVGLRDTTTNVLANIALQTGTSWVASVTQGHGYAWDVASCSTFAGGDNTTNCPNRAANRTFTVQGAAPGTPVLSSPAAGAVLSGTSVTLVWNPVSGAGAYSVGLRDTTTNVLANIALQTGTSWVASVTQGHGYAWDVASCSTFAGGDNTTNCPNRAANRTFTVQGAAPGTPVLSSPAAGAVLSGTSVTLVWNPVSGAGAYSVGLRDTTTNVLANIALQTGTSWVASVTQGHGYAWDVASCSTFAGGDNTTNCPNRAANRTFTVQGAAPGTPVLSSPAAGAVLSGTSVTLVWNPVSGAGAYSVGLRDTTTNVLANIALQTGTSWVASVTQGHGYAWDVASCSTFAGGDNTTNCPNRAANRTFTVQGAAPGTPVLSSPAAGAVLSGTSVTLVWNPVSGAGAYSVGLRDTTTNVLANIALQTGTSWVASVTQGHGYAWDVA